MLRFFLPLMFAVCACTPMPAGVDAGVPDASRPEDGGAPDASIADAGATDAGEPPDAGTPDAGAADAGAPDAGPRDAGVDAGVLTVGADGCLIDPGATVPFRVRAVAANLSSGNLQSYDPGEGLRILQGIAPDVVMLQEFNVGDKSPAAIDQFVNALSPDAGFTWARGLSGNIPNGVISRWPIDASGDWVDPEVDNRAFTWAHIDLPGPRDLWAISVHLLTANAGTRNREATALLAEITDNIPLADFVLIAGDFNTGGRGEACFNSLEPRASCPAPYPTDQSGNDATNAPRSFPYDAVLASKCLLKYQRPIVAGGVTLDGGLVVDTRVYTPLSELSPALVTDSAATNMQHMAVVKDFLVRP